MLCPGVSLAGTERRKRLLKELGFLCIKNCLNLRGSGHAYLQLEQLGVGSREKEEWPRSVHPAETSVSAFLELEFSERLAGHPPRMVVLNPTRLRGYEK